MRTLTLVILGSALLAGRAEASDSRTGSGALALAALVGIHSPQVSAASRTRLSMMLDGKLGFASNAPITVVARQVTCRASDVDISAQRCELAFGQVTRLLQGRAAHELYATLVENGVAPDGAAGSIFEAVSHLSCTVEPRVVKQKGGGGASCSFDAGPGS